MHPLGPELRAFSPSPRALHAFRYLGVAIAVPMVARRILLAEDLSFWAVLVIVLAAAVSVLALPLLFRPLLWFFPVRVHELGIQAYDAYGRKARVSWSQIHDVSPVSLLTLTYLRLHITGAERIVWLPHFLSNQDGFDRLVAERAGAGHPLARSLAAPGA